MRLRMLSGILIVSIAVLGFQKWSKYESTRPIRETEQRLSQLLRERSIPLNPALAKKTISPITSIPSPVEPQKEKPVGPPEEKKPITPAA